MDESRIYEGVFDEVVSRHHDELSGLRVKVIVDNADQPAGTVGRPFHETASDEEWVAALRAWSERYRPKGPVLTDESVDRENIYQGRA
ncbi:MAG TPA: hypothetical protein VKT77_09395 [Chthonomonadaceae bacterium]|nr:hypothetical protein [Chthonomonadaceae bacterium]